MERNNVKGEPLLLPSRKVLFLPLHLKLKQFGKSLHKESAAFKYLQDFFPKLSAEKFKTGVGVGLQITIIECKEFPKNLTRMEKAVGNSFVVVVRDFLVNHEAEKYLMLVETLRTTEKWAAGYLSISISLPLILINPRITWGAYSAEQGGRFHQDILDFETRYQGSYNENMGVDL